MPLLLEEQSKTASERLEKQHRGMMLYRLMREESLHQRLWTVLFSQWKRQWNRHVRDKRIYERLEEAATKYRAQLKKADKPSATLMVERMVGWPFKEPTVAGNKILVQELVDGYNGGVAMATQNITGLAIDFRLRNPAMLAEIQRAGEKIVVGAAKTQVERIRNTLRQEFFEKGKGAREVRRMFRTQFEDAYRGQGMLIARTETKNIIGQANMDAMVHNGVEGKGWRTTSENPCEGCQGNDGVEVGVSESFPNWGESEADSHPGCYCYVYPVAQKPGTPEPNPGQPEAWRQFEGKKDAEAWGKKEFAAWEKGLPKPEWNALDRYQGGGYSPINRALRTGKIPTHVEPYISHIDSALAKAKMTENVTVFRGCSNPKWLKRFDKLEGKVIKDKAFCSTSLARSTAEHFCEIAEGKPILIEIRMAKGTRAAFIGGGAEQEVLLARDTAMRVITAGKDAKGLRRMVVEVMSEAA